MACVSNIRSGVIVTNTVTKLKVMLTIISFLVCETKVFMLKFNVKVALDVCLVRPADSFSFFLYVLVNIKLKMLTVHCTGKIVVIKADVLNNILTKLSVTGVTKLTRFPCNINVTTKVTVLNVLVRFTVGGSQCSRRSSRRRSSSSKTLPRRAEGPTKESHEKGDHRCASSHGESSRECACRGQTGSSQRDQNREHSHEPSSERKDGSSEQREGCTSDQGESKDREGDGNDSAREEDASRASNEGEASNEGCTSSSEENHECDRDDDAERQEGTKAKDEFHCTSPRGRRSCSHFSRSRGESDCRSFRGLRRGEHQVSVRGVTSFSRRRRCKGCESSPSLVGSRSLSRLSR